MLICVLACISTSREIRANGLENSGILHDERVGAGLHDCRAGAAASSDLMFEDQSIECQVAAHAAGMQRLHHFRQFVEVKADFRARRKMLQAEIHRVRARFDGGVELWPVSGRAHDFRFLSGTGVRHEFPAHRNAGRLLQSTAPIHSERRSSTLLLNTCFANRIG